MRKNKLLTAMIVATILLQLFTFVSLVRGDAMPIQSSNVSPSQNSGFAINFLGYFKNCACVLNCFFNRCIYHHPRIHRRPPAPYLTISPQSATIAAGQTQTYSAIEHFANGYTVDVSNNPCTVWAINSGAGTFAWTGSSVTVTAAGNWTVTATYNEMSDNAFLTVTHAGIDKISRLTASVNPTTVEAPNSTVGTATAYDIYGNSWDVSTLATWSIPAGGDGGSWTLNVYTSHTAGTYIVQAAYGCKTATTSLTVTHAVASAYLERITASLSPSTVAAPGNVTGTATAYDEFNNSWDISTLAAWSIPAGGDGGKWTQNVYSSHTAGNYTVQAAYEGKTANASLTVTHATAQEYLDHITASLSPSKIAAPGNVTGTATAYDNFGNSWNISTLAVWSIPSGGDGGSWSRNVYTSHTAGTYTVQAAYKGKTATASLTVTPATNEIDHIIILPENATVNVGVFQNYTATAYDIFGNSWSVTAVYSCTNDSVVISGNSAFSNFTGIYTITGTYGGKSDNATLNVVGHLATIISIAVSPKIASIEAGNAQSYTATATDGYNTWDVTGSVIWSINSTAGGHWAGSTYTSANAGVWIVQAKLGSLSSTATLTVTANPALLKNIIISPKTATVPAGTAQTYSTTAYDQFGNSLGNVTSSTTFSAPGATVTGNSVESNTAGKYTVTATYKGLTDNATLTVTGSTSTGTSTGTSTATTYSVSFTENGLPAGTTWTVTFDGQKYTSTSSTLTIDDLTAQSYTWSTAIIQNGQTRYQPVQTSGSLTVPNQLTQNIVYTTQYLVSYSAIGNAIPISVPANEWVSSGGKATGSFPTEVTNEAQDTRCNFLSDNRTESITQPTTITGKYETQYTVTFIVTSIQSDAKGTILTVSSTSEGYLQLPDVTWVDNGTELIFNFATSVQTTSANKIYSLTSVNATSPLLIEKPETIQGNYKTQYSVVLYTVLLVALLLFVIILTTTLLLRYRRSRIRREQSINLSRLRNRAKG